MYKLGSGEQWTEVEFLGKLRNNGVEVAFGKIREQLAEVDYGDKLYNI